MISGDTISRTAMLGRPHRELQGAIRLVSGSVELPYLCDELLPAGQIQRLLFFVDAGFERGQQRVDFLDVGLRANGMQVNGYFFLSSPGGESS